MSLLDDDRNDIPGVVISYPLSSEIHNSSFSEHLMSLSDGQIQTNQKILLRQYITTIPNDKIIIGIHAENGRVRR